MIGPDALATLDAGCAPARQWHVARPSPAASRSSDAALRLRLEHVAKARRSEDVSAASGSCCSWAKLPQAGTLTGSGRDRTARRSALLCQGTKGLRSAGLGPPLSAQACQKALNPWCGLRPHRESVCRTRNISAATGALHTLPEPQEFFRPTTGWRRRRSAVLWSIAPS